MKRTLLPAAFLALLPAAFLAALLLAGCPPKTEPPPAQPVQLGEADYRAFATKAIEDGLESLRKRDADSDGAWEVNGARMAGITAMVLLAHFQSPLKFSEKTHPQLWKGLRWLASLQHPTGEIYQKMEGNSNYVTSVSLLAFILSGDPEFGTTVENAKKYLIDSQMTDGEFEGGFGYQDKAKTKDQPYADIVNTEFALEALSRANLPADHPAWARAVKYLSKCQHFSENNPATWVTDIGAYRGGFVYHPDASKAGETPTVIQEGGKSKTILPPYGSVTYAGIKSMIYSHLSKDDPRVLAATEWMKNHWTVDENPGFDVKRDPNLGKQGYFYYFVTFSKALHALGIEEVKDSKGVSHAWRKELVEKIVSLQDKQAKSWKNTWHKRWFEDLDELATSYAVIALSFAIMK